ncbi:hypothetical protein COU60_05040 [Candidatus Pacearchaeota archaeon CG10_big_fil_rev_8_21_14_0_10_34_76]|nr:MAG: hypothetical protein COU60_05040 [Candidatus Pacearchaeota archaeon CG10_big_fil_rev_8_21_14_0_10_34_76]
MEEENIEVEEQDVEVIEVEMNMGEIDEMIGKLNELIQNKESVEIDVADDLQLKLNYSEDEGEEEDGE